MFDTSANTITTNSSVSEHLSIVSIATPIFQLKKLDARARARVAIESSIEEICIEFCNTFCIVDRSVNVPYASAIDAFTIFFTCNFARHHHESSIHADISPLVRVHRHSYFPSSSRIERTYTRDRLVNRLQIQF